MVGQPCGYKFVAAIRAAAASDPAGIAWLRLDRELQSHPLHSLACLSTRWLGAYRPVRWGVSRLPDVLAGIVAGIVGIFWKVILLTCDLILVPDAYARRHGVLGCMLGLFLAPFWMVGRLIHAAVLLRG